MDLNNRKAIVQLRLRTDLHRLAETPSSFDFYLENEKDTSEFSLIRIFRQGASSNAKVVVERSAHSYFPVYLYALRNSKLIISDTMAHILPVISSECKKLDKTALLNHLLMGQSPSNPYIAGGEVVAHGERVVMELQGDRFVLTDRTIYDRFVHENRRVWLDSVYDCENILRQSVESSHPNINLFSGGVDSTLIQSMFKGEDALAVTARISSPEFQPECQLALKSSSLLNCRHSFVDIDENTYLQKVADATRQTGIPVPAMQHPLILAVLDKEAHANSIVCGYKADAIFGSGLASQHGLHQWLISSEFQPEYAASIRFHTSNQRSEDDVVDDFLCEFIGDPKAFHLARVKRALNLTEINGIKRPWSYFLIIGHTINYISEDQIAFVRDLAASKLKKVYAPFNDRQLIDQFNSINASTRYVEDGISKPMLKHILAKRLPYYNLRNLKLGSGLPRTRYFLNGPLKNAFKTYPPPPILQELLCAIGKPTWTNSWVLWPALSYSIWYNECLQKELPDRVDLSSYTIDLP
jgi:hypothetical protein